MKKLTIFLFTGLLLSLTFKAKAQTSEFFLKPYHMLIGGIDQVTVNSQVIQEVSLDNTMYDPSFPYYETVQDNYEGNTLSLGYGIGLPVSLSSDGWNAGIEGSVMGGAFIKTENLEDGDASPLLTISAPAYVFIRKNELLRSPELTFGLLLGARYTNVEFEHQYVNPEIAAEIGKSFFAIRCHAALQQAKIYTNFTSEGPVPTHFFKYFGVSVLITPF